MDISELSIDCKEYKLHGRYIAMTEEARPHLIFLHDALGSVDSWKKIAVDLCTRLDLNGLIYSRRGHGSSDALPDIKNLDFFEIETRELRHVITTLGIEHPILIGSSDGGTIALKYAARYTTTGIVSIAGHYMVEEATLTGIRSMMSHDKDTRLRSGLKKYHGDKADLLVDSWQKGWLHPAFRSWNISEEVSKIDCPSLIIQGSKDEYATPYHAYSLAESIGEHAHVELIQDIGHFPHKECPEKTTDIITSFTKHHML